MTEFAYLLHGQLCLLTVKGIAKLVKVANKRARKTVRDMVPITPIPRSEVPFTHWFMNCLGPIFNHKVEYNYRLVLVDSATRWPAAFPLRAYTGVIVTVMLSVLMIESPV